MKYQFSGVRIFNTEKQILNQVLTTYKSGTFIQCC